MKVVLLAGGQGTRLAEETDVRPKPMVEVGYRPLLWHIMKHYASFGHSEFVVALGYKGEYIKRYFADYVTLSGDVTVRLKDHVVERHRHPDEDWTVHMVESGFDTNTGGRVARVGSWVAGERFMLTYGDGVSTVDLDSLVAYHEAQGKLATITAVRPPSRFGGLDLRDDGAVGFTEKSQMGEGWINGGFMVFEPGVLDYISGDAVSLEADVLERLALEGKLAAYRHHGFWQSMDTLRDVRYLRALWTEGNAPWATWE